MYTSRLDYFPVDLLLVIVQDFVWSGLAERDTTFMGEDLISPGEVMPLNHTPMIFNLYDDMFAVA